MQLFLHAVILRTTRSWLRATRVLLAINLLY